ncbi:MAG: biopolymer transporter ExbD [Myxococcaceae bacterium]|nr:biopolymer transporter ExbD [Myxococcaceae bacterium]
MAMGKVPGTGGDDSLEEGVFADINITPLTDIFLVLLIIFMVTSTVIVRRADTTGSTRSGIKVNLPKGNAADVMASRTDLPVAILEDGRVVLSGNVVSMDELKQAFEKAKTDNAETLVIVQADQGVPHGKVVEVMELAKKAGLGQLAIGVRAETP